MAIKRPAKNKVLVRASDRNGQYRLEWGPHGWVPDGLSGFDMDWIEDHKIGKNRYRSGCRVFTYRQAIRHWSERAKVPPTTYLGLWSRSRHIFRARQFLRAIEKHHQRQKDSQ